MIGRKLYYEITTRDVILIVPEKHAQNLNLDVQVFLDAD